MARRLRDAGAVRYLEIPIKQAPGSALKLLSDVDKTVLRINKYGLTHGSVAECLLLIVRS